MVTSSRSRGSRLVSYYTRWRCPACDEVRETHPCSTVVGVCRRLPQNTLHVYEPVGPVRETITVGGTSTNGHHPSHPDALEGARERWGHELVEAEPSAEQRDAATQAVEWVSGELGARTPVIRWFTGRGLGGLANTQISDEIWLNTSTPVGDVPRVAFHECAHAIGGEEDEDGADLFASRMVSSYRRAHPSTREERLAVADEIRSLRARYN